MTPNDPQNNAKDNANTMPYGAEQATSTVLEDTLNEFNPNNNANQNGIASEVNLDTFHARIAELEGQVKEAKEAHARANADAYNARNRMEQETEKTKKYAVEKFAKSLLDVVDNLERAIASTNEESPFLEGVKLTHKSLMTALEKNNIQAVDPQDEKFNADFHEAVGIDPNAPADTVGEVLQKGYVLNDRLLRPAMVRVGQ